MEVKFLTYTDLDNEIRIEAYYVHTEDTIGGSRYDDYVKVNIRAKHKTIPLKTIMYPNVQDFLEKFKQLTQYIAIGG